MLIGKNTKGILEQEAQIAALKKGIGGIKTINIKS